MVRPYESRMNIEDPEKKKARRKSVQAFNQHLEHGRYLHLPKFTRINDLMYILRNAECIYLEHVQT